MPSLELLLLVVSVDCPMFGLLQEKIGEDRTIPVGGAEEDFCESKGRFEVIQE